MSKEGISSRQDSIQAEAEHDTGSDEEELLNAIRQALGEVDGDKDGQRMSEIAKRLGVGVDRARRAARKLIDAGEMMCVMIPHKTITGRYAKVPHYRLTKSERGQND